MELASNSSLPNVVETLVFSFLSTVLSVLQHGILDSLVDAVMKCVHYLQMKSIIALDFFLEKARTGNG